MTYQFNFFTEYSQFYLCDKNSPMETGSEKFWTDQALENNLATEEGILGIASEGHGIVQGDINILEEERKISSFDGYDHIVEGSIAIPSGTVQLLNCPDSVVQVEFKLNPGFYRVRVYTIDFAAQMQNGNHGIYSIEIWRQMPSETKVLKKYSRE